MTTLKTQPTNRSIDEFIESIEHIKRKEDCQTLLKIMQEQTGEKPRIWGENIIGFGQYHYKYNSGREGDWFITGFSPRKQNLSIYIMTGFKGYTTLLEKLGKHRTGSSCLYVNKLDDIDLNILKTLISDSYLLMKKKYIK
ncbi:DUF1801 domain-containing protein [Mangrovivirga sp. M17]|uniref:DUF1801 domain-containing protein n=1 Tax=Mangrovivirga halotolerans TaxID=2993936 RepID=A0ABT3RNI8_9BACT|nr:DUF1801 domain-containing protein [Mangrovivirga halotolerans]MCX2743088.1 DUF1801 domain-containing protein [Mangrovivirga halotolerans]